MIVSIQEEILVMLPPRSSLLADHSVSHGLSGRDGGYDGGGEGAGSKACPGGGSSSISRGGSSSDARQASTFQGGDGRNAWRSSADGGSSGRSMARDDTREPALSDSSWRPPLQGLPVVYSDKEGDQSAWFATPAGQTGCAKTFKGGAGQSQCGNTQRQSLPAGLHKISGARKERDRDKMARLEPRYFKVSFPSHTPQHAC